MESRYLIYVDSGGTQAEVGFPADRSSLNRTKREDMPDEVMKLMSFYRQPVRRQPATVEYLPSRRDVDADDPRP